MRLLALTGGLASGKSRAGQYFMCFGIPVIDADQIVHTLLASPSKCREEIVDTFGSKVLSEDGRIDRRLLSSVVFEDEDARRRLEEIVHPAVMEEARRRANVLSQMGFRFAMLEAALVFETGIQDLFHATVLVTARRETRIERARQRMGFSDREVRARIAAQWPDERKAELATFVIENDSSLEELRREVAGIVARLTVGEQS